MGSYTFTAPPPDIREYVTGVCGRPSGACEFDRRGRSRKRLTRLAIDAVCGCGAPLVDVQPT